MSRRIHGEEGALTAFVAVLALALFALIGLVVDGGAALTAKRSALDIAEQAARAGAGAVSVDQLRRGYVEVDPAAAVRAATASLQAAGVHGSASVVGDEVEVHDFIDEPTVILGIVGIRRIQVSADASATLVHGVAGED
jgi:hypothetical protein